MTKANKVRDDLEFAPIGKAEDIAKLPWAGNAYSDMGLLRAIARFVARTTDRAQLRLAGELLGSVGMGIDDPMSEEELDEWIAGQKEWGNNLLAWVARHTFQSVLYWSCKERKEWAD